MIFLRHFTKSDAETIQTLMYPGLSSEETDKMLGEWDECSYQGKYFEMFAIEANGRIVGNASLMEKSEQIVSLGIEVFPNERRKGYAYQAMTQLCKLVAGKGYKIALDQIRTDNIASFKLHEKLGFGSTGNIIRNSKGNEVFLYAKVISESEGS